LPHRAIQQGELAMTEKKSADPGKPTVSADDKGSRPENPIVPPSPDKLGGIIWDKIGTFTIKTIIPIDDDP
jgi:hypothetical protein